jgi:hypothetical protein
MRLSIPILTLSLLFTGCGGSSSEEYVSEGGNYSVTMPGKPKVTESTENTPAGPLTMNLATLDTPEQVNYTVTYTEFPPNAVAPDKLDAMLNNSVKAMSRAGNWAVIDTKGKTLSNVHPGREVSFEATSPQAPEKGRGIARLYVVGPRLYQIISIGPESKVTKEELLAFQDSFKLTKDIPPIASASSPAPPAAISQEPQSPPGSKAMAAATGIPSNPAPQPSAPSQAPQPSAPTASPASGPPDYTLPPPAPTSAGGAEILAFEWTGDKSDLIGGNSVEPNNEPDEQFRLDLRMPQGAILKEIDLLNQGGNHWRTVDDGFHWQIAVLRGTETITKSHTPSVGEFSGDVSFDLYLNAPGGGFQPGAPFEIRLLIVVDGAEHRLAARTTKPAAVQ